MSTTNEECNQNQSSRSPSLNVELLGSEKWSEREFARTFDFQVGQILILTYETCPELKRRVRVIEVFKNHLIVDENGKIKHFKKERILSVEFPTSPSSGRDSIDSTFVEIEEKNEQNPVDTRGRRPEFFSPISRKQSSCADEEVCEIIKVRNPSRISLTDNFPTLRIKSKREVKVTYKSGEIHLEVL